MYSVNQSDETQSARASRTYDPRDTRDKPGRPAGREGRRAADAGTGRARLASRRTDRIAAAEQSLQDAHRAVIAAGTDPDLVEPAFAIAQDCLAEAKTCSDLARRELALANYERAEAHKKLLSAGSYAEDVPQPVVPDMRGLSLCPDPTAAKTATAFVNVLRMYHVWAGKPSYRVMRHRLNGRFGASTLHNALHSEKLPSLEMVQAVISACRGTEEHQQAYASAWRMIAMDDQMRRKDHAGRTAQSRTLYSISEPA